MTSVPVDCGSARPATLIGLAMALVGPGLVALGSLRLTAAPLPVRGLGLLAFAALWAVVLFIARRIEHLPLSRMGFLNTSWRSTLWAAALAGFFILVWGPLLGAAMTRWNLGSFRTGTALLRGLPGWYLTLAVIVVAAGEEWLYRGYAMERLQSLTGRVWAAAGLSLTAFTLSHIPLWGVGPALVTSLSGALLTVLYVWRRDVAFLMMAHVATDLYGLVVASPR